MNTKQFVRRYGIRATSEWADSNPNMDGSWDANHYKVTLRRLQKQMTVYFSMGMAHTNEPTAEDVLDCLASDAAGYENGGSFEDWCSEYGYDEDSRRAERIYKTIERQSKRLEKFLGHELYQELLWETERL